MTREQAIEFLAQSEEISEDEVKILFPDVDIREYMRGGMTLQYQFWVGPDEKLYLSTSSAPGGVGLVRLSYWRPERGARDHFWEVVYDWYDERSTD